MGGVITLKPSLVQEQKLERKMTQTLLQSIQLLQYTGVELIEYIHEISKENPLIEDVNYDEDITRFKINNTNQTPIGEINQTQASMYNQLKRQLKTLAIASELKTTVDYGIDSLNSDGYLDIDIESWANHCQATTKQVEQALSFIQSLEPLGIGARSLSECLYLQLKNQVDETLILDILNHHLKWVGSYDLESLSTHYDLSVNEVEKIIELIKTCHPKPGLLLETKQANYIVPEANIIKKDGAWHISFFKWNRPNIVVDESYENLLQIGGETATYLKEKYRQVDWLNQAITYRSNTLELIIKQILLKQSLYFEHGHFLLKPLTLREVAEELNLSISTVSRAVSQKYVQTQHGVTPLKFFFQSGVRQHDGQVMSAYSVKHLIAEIIQHEDKVKPLSDEAIKNTLHEEFNIQIARRTVRKYRNELNIPASTKRR